MVAPAQSNAVSAVLLMQEESSAAAARASLQTQLLKLGEIFTVRQISPFGAAFNQGAAQVQSEFFLQCDADMVLFPECAGRLLQAMTPRTAVAVALLQDPLQGLIRGVKLFRTIPCQSILVGSEPDCETIHLAKMLRQGWELARVDEVLGEHREDLSDELYQFERFRRIGHKIRVRQSWADLTYRLQQLAWRSHLPISASCAAALLSGLVCSERVIHQRLEPSPEYARWGTKSPWGVSVGSYAGQDCPFRAGYEFALKENPNREETVRSCLSANSIPHWIFLAGYVAASSDALGRSVEELQPRIAPFQKYLEANFDAHSGGGRIWET